MKITRGKQRKNTELAITRGGTNVFTDLGFPAGQASNLKAKADLSLQIHHRIKELGLTQSRAAAQLGISQPDVSKLLNGKFTGFTVERLMALLNALGVDLDILVRPRAHKRKVKLGIVRVFGAATL